MTTSMGNNSFVSYMNDWHQQDLGTDFDLFQDLPLTLPSLDGNSEQPTDFVSVNLEPFLLEDDIIKNHDCMWSGNTSPVSTHSSTSSHNINSSFIKVKEEPIDSAYTAIGVAVSVQAIIPDSTKPNYNHNKQRNTIAPGMSLLKKNQPFTIVKKELGSPSYESMPGRPDTPFSLDDEVKHAVDFYSCSIGSNNIPLEPFDKTSFIKDIRKQLEDPNTMKINLPGNNRIRTMSIIDEVIRDNITDESDTDDDSSLSMIPIRHSKMMLHNSKYRNAGVIQTQSDHSYSRSKYGEINYETPIESDEEIDVVNLPTNPSEKDRRALQTKMEYEIRKSNNSLRRRISFDPSYTPQSISPDKSSSLANSRYPSPAQTPKYVGSIAGQRKRVNDSAGHIIVNQNVRDDYLPPTSKRHRSNFSHNSKISKKMSSPSSLSSSSSTTSSCSGPASPTKQRHFSIDDIDSNEKRNLHNDMERQRRIGLKNLFEALKKQIPSIKEKERAPKVNILREAAKLCDQLSSEEQIVLRQKQVLKEEIRQRQDRLRRLKSMNGR